MEKTRILSVLFLALILVNAGCGGAGGSSSGTAPSAVPGGENSEAPASPSPAANPAPVANAGLDQTTPRGTVAYLDGTASSDSDGDLLSFQWTIISKPDGSMSTLSGADQPSPYFMPDLDGNYVIQLIVVDPKGLASSPDTVIVSTINSAPIADAGADQLLTSLGMTVNLVGDGSWDPDDDLIAYSWTMKSKPDKSLAVLSDPASPTPTFVADVYGDYVIELVVNDPLASSPPDTVTVSFGNLTPVADAGNSFAAAKGSVVYLDGSRSYDPNSDPITYQWNFVYKPAGSAAELMAPTTVNPYFNPDVAGTYVISLVVSDGSLKSDPGSATIAVFSTLNPPIKELMDALSALNSLSRTDFKNRNMQKKLAVKINMVIAAIDAGNYAVALSELKTDIVKKMDGCAKKGSPEHNDWITNCPAQGTVYPHVALAIAELEVL